MWLMSLIAALGVALPTSLATPTTGIATTYGGPEGSPPGDGNCNLMDWLPMSSKGYHVAINNEQWGLGMHCGRCVQIKCVDKACSSFPPAIAQITDRCPGCPYGDLDMALPVFKAVTGQSTGRLQVSWTFVDCPVDGGIKVCAKSGSSQWWLALQATNTVNGVQAMNINDGTSALLGGTAYYFLAKNSGALSSTRVTLTSFSGDTITTTVGLAAGQCTQISQQFQSSGGAPQPQPQPQPAPQPAPAPAPAGQVPVAPASLTTRLQLPFSLVTNDGQAVLEFYSNSYMGTNSFTANYIWTYNAPTQQLLSRSAMGQCLDAYKGSDGKMYVHTWACDGGNNNQKWLVANGLVKHAVWPNLCLDANPGTADHSVQVWPCVNGNTNQRINPSTVMKHVAITLRSQGVALTANRDGSVAFRAPNPSFNGILSDQGAMWTFDHGVNTVVTELTGLCLTLSTGANGVVPTTAPCSISNGNQQWQYDPSSKALRHMVHQGYCLDMDVNSKKAQVWSCHGGLAQQFAYER
ncbi:hypothetical protein ACHHYP_10896 [Achlya hypogyna]|uniref:Secreted protein n=1 Tax=Achlya hypogyna TaxID=1202772 RepID=A0A0A7CNY5_ACHHY|nr:secreted protein [Achlya hypogyna]OQR97507.1 hypothetical protein ACHHYP_10896 [Achlya hypogyna]